MRLPNKLGRPTTTVSPSGHSPDSYACESICSCLISSSHRENLLFNSLSPIVAMRASRQTELFISTSRRRRIRVKNEHSERLFAAHNLNRPPMLIESDGNKIDFSIRTSTPRHSNGIAPRVKNLLLRQTMHQRMLVHEHVVHRTLLMSCIIRPRNCPFNSPHRSGCSLSNRPCRAFTRSLRRALRNLARTMPTSSLGSCEKLGVVARPSIRFARRASRIGESTSWLDRFARHPASSQKHIDSSAPQTAAPTNKFILLEPSLFLPPAASGPKQQQSRPQFRERLLAK